MIRPKNVVLCLQQYHSNVLQFLLRKKNIFHVKIHAHSHNCRSKRLSLLQDITTSAAAGPAVGQEKSALFHLVGSSNVDQVSLARNLSGLGECLWQGMGECLWQGVGECLWEEDIWECLWQGVGNVSGRVLGNVSERGVGNGCGRVFVGECLWQDVWECLWEGVGECLCQGVGE